MLHETESCCRMFIYKIASSGVARGEGARGGGHGGHAPPQTFGEFSN